MLLADLGADVVKVENPEGGDQTRRSWADPGAGKDSGAFHALNPDKRSISVDLESDEVRRSTSWRARPMSWWRTGGRGWRRSWGSTRRRWPRSAPA